MDDLQSGPDARGIEIESVGITGVQHPVNFNDGRMLFSGVAEIECTVTLPSARRGTHMSRMVELAQEHLTEFDPRDLPQVLKDAGTRLDVASARLALSMPFATQVYAPSTGSPSWQVHQLHMSGELIAGNVRTATEVRTFVTSLCPCSKAISDYGAHNQRSEVGARIEGSGDDPYPIGVADLVEVLRGAGSCAIFPLIKRPDERAITMEAFDHPMFVEDMARNLALALKDRKLAGTVRVQSFESIHTHDAVAVVRVAGEDEGTTAGAC